MYLIKNATVHIGNCTVLQQIDVLVEGKVIKEVGKNLSAEAAEVIDELIAEVRVLDKTSIEVIFKFKDIFNIDVECEVV